MLDKAKIDKLVYDLAQVFIENRVDGDIRLTGCDKCGAISFYVENCPKRGQARMASAVELTASSI